MFPSPVGAEFAEAVRNGVDPKAVVPDDIVIVHGGAGATVPLGKTISGAAGKNLEEAAAAVPHGTIRVTTAGAIRARGGVVEWDPEISRHARVSDGARSNWPLPRPKFGVPFN